jgi:hypothetical protein
MSQLIYQGDVRTELGAGEVRITDTAPDGDTPSLRRIAPDGSIRLEMGDRGQADDDLPTSIGSFFQLSFEDTPGRAFQNLFGQVFDESRFEVELELPGGDIWHGYVKSTLQQRPLSRRTRPGQVSVTCYDRLAALSGEDAVQSFTTDIKTFVETAFAAANPNLDIVIYFDPSSGDVEGGSADLSDMVPFDGQATEYQPRTGEPEGLPGDNLRAQLDALCGTALAAAYQDVRLGAWAIVDVPSIGAPVTGHRYDGSSWSTYTLPDQTTRPSDIADEGSGRLEAMPSTIRVCSENAVLNPDPSLEQYTDTGVADALYYWSAPNSDMLLQASFQTVGPVALDLDDGDSVSQTFDASVQIGTVTDLAIYVEGLNENRDDDPDYNLDVETTITYEDGTTDTVTTNEVPKVNEVRNEGLPFEVYRHLHPLDTNKDEIATVDITVTAAASPGDDAQIDTVSAEAIVSEDVVQPDGTTIQKRRRAETICFQPADAQGRRRVEDDRGSALTELTNGRATPDSWSSDKFSDTYPKLWIWRATQILALQPPGYEKLRGRILGELAPLGTRIKWTKPGDDTVSTFVPLKGRTLHLASDKMSAGTQVKDVEIPAAVTELLP